MASSVQEILLCSDFFLCKFIFKTFCIIKIYIELSWRFLILYLNVNQSYVLRIIFLLKSYQCLLSLGMFYIVFVFVYILFPCINMVMSLEDCSLYLTLLHHCNLQSL